MSFLLLKAPGVVVTPSLISEVTEVFGEKEVLNTRM
jgi:hypothetical protein